MIKKKVNIGLGVIVECDEDFEPSNIWYQMENYDERRITTKQLKELTDFRNSKNISYSDKMKITYWDMKIEKS